MITHKENNEEEMAGFELFGFIETMIRDWKPPNEEQWIQRLTKIHTHDQAMDLLSELEQYRPIMGLHSWPMDQKEMREAVRFQVDKDDFKERKK